MNDHAYFQTRLFNSTEVKPHFINPRCFGEDTAAWLAARLGDEHISCDSPFQEDWGWRLPVQIDGAKFFINVGLTEDDSDVPMWLAWVEPRGLASRISGSASRASLCQHLDNVLKSSPEISNVEWSDA